MPKLLASRPVVEKTRDILSEETKILKGKGVVPTMKVILVGDHPPSLIYTRNKKKFCESFGADCEIVSLPEEVSEEEFLATVELHAKNPKVHGLFVQLPLPKHLKHIDVGQIIPPKKDVDGFHAENITALFLGDKGQRALLPCTPKGIITICRHYDIELEGKHVVIIGRSAIVGRPAALLLTNHNATVTICHSKTKCLEHFTRQADIIISAIGIPNFLTDHHIGENLPTVIDVGINHDENGNLCGDADFDAIRNKVSAITPVPGGVGPMTILSLAQNLLQATKKSL